MNLPTPTELWSRHRLFHDSPQTIMEVHTPFSLPGSSALGRVDFSPSSPEGPLHQPPQWHAAKPRSRRWIPIAVVVIVLGALGGGYYAYSKGYIAIPYLTPKAEALFGKMVDSLTDIKNAQYSFRIGVKSEAKEPGATPLFLEDGSAPSALGDGLGALGYFGFGTGSDSLFSSIPTDMELEGGITFYAENTEDTKTSDAFVTIDGTYQGGDLTVQVDIEARKKAETLYAIVNKFPSLFFLDLSAIKGKWIEVSPDETTWYSENTLDTIDQQQYVEEVKTVLTTALEKELWTAEGNLPAEVIGGVKTQHYRVVAHPEKLPDVYRALIEKKRAKGEDAQNLEDGLKDAEDPDSVEQLKRLIDNSQFEIWIDRVHGTLRQISWRLRAVPPEDSEKWKGKQLTLTLRATLEKVNERVAVAAPSDTIDTDEVTRLMTGVSKEEQQFDKQLDSVEAVRSALRQYHDELDAYPKTLTDIPDGLQTAYEQCVQNAETDAKNGNANSNPSTSFEITYLSDPKYRCSSLESAAKKKLRLTDVYTDKPYAYNTADGDYSLVYTIEYSEGLGDGAKQDFAEGNNTATSGLLSKERETKSRGYYPPAPTTKKARDAQRISDVRQIQSALELYYNDQKTPSYPAIATPGTIGKEQLSDTYLSSVPSAPTPADGACTEAENAYIYSAYTLSDGKTLCTPGSSCAWYQIVFCLGDETGGMSAGKVYASPTGISNTETFPAPVITNTNGTASSNQNRNVATNTSTVDADGDGIADTEEAYFGTNPAEKDTDDDGFADFTEIENGYNPNGTGTIAREGTWSACIAGDNRTCAEYCQSVGKTCSNLGITSRGYKNWGGEAWGTATACTTGPEEAGGQVFCTRPLDGASERWKCFCR